MTVSSRLVWVSSKPARVREKGRLRDKVGHSEGQVQVGFGRATSIARGVYKPSYNQGDPPVVMVTHLVLFKQMGMCTI